MSAAGLVAGGRSLARRAEMGYDSDDDKGYGGAAVDGGGGVASCLTATGKALRGALVRAMTYGTLNLADIRNRKAAFGLGMVSVFTVVVVTALMSTTLTYLPVLFYRLGEIELGQMDVVLRPGSQASLAATLNYTRIAQQFQPPALQSFHSPRIEMTFDWTQIQIWKAADCKVFNRSSFPPRGGGPVPTASLWTTQGAVGLAPSKASTSSPSSAGLSEQCSPRIGCVARQCRTAGLATTLTAIDFLREDRAEIGRDFDVPAARNLAKSEAVIDTGLATFLGLSVGDAILLWGDVQGPMRQSFLASGLADSAFPPYSSYGGAIISLTVAGIAGMGGGGKFPGDTQNFVLVNYATVNELIADSLSPLVPDYKRAAFARSDPYIAATEVIVNYPPASKARMYAHTDWLDILSEAALFFTPIVSALGYNQLSSSLPIVTYLQGTRLFSLFLGLILSIIITALSFLSVILIYSLLTVGIQTRTFDLGVMRMVGMARGNLAVYVLVGAAMFSLPALVLGLIAAQGLFIIIRQVLQDQLRVYVPWPLDPPSIGYASLAAIAIPVVSSIAPILEVLSQQLPDALNTSRGKIVTIAFDIVRLADKTINLYYIIFGSVVSVVGFLIYYLFPLSLLTNNLTLLFYIFFALLLGMLFGFTLLSSNFQRIVEKAFTYVYFFWESPAVFQILQKNLIAHGRRNKTTALMYSASLSFVIFITVAFGIEIESQKYTIFRRLGGAIKIGASSGRALSGAQIPFETVEQLDGILVAHSGLRANSPPGSSPISLLGPQEVIDRVSPNLRWTWVTAPMAYQGRVGNNTIETIGHYAARLAPVLAVAPNFFDVAEPSFLALDSRVNSREPLSSFLYTKEGSATAILPTSYRNELGMESFDRRATITVMLEPVNGSTVSYRNVVTPAALIDDAPVLRFTKFPETLQLDVVMSLPAMIRRSRGAIQSIHQLRFLSLVIDCGDAQECPPGLVDDLLQASKSFDFGGGKVELLSNLLRPLSTASLILDFFFLFTLIVAMWICFFSLSSSMTTNIYEQSKEIGVLRSIGLRKFPCWRVYVWEAFIVVQASSALGLVIGTAVAYTVLLQRTLFTQLPLPFVFPYLQVGTIFGLSIAFAFLASFAPIRHLLSAPSVTSILRRTV